MRFKVTLEIEEWVEADSAKEAQLKFKEDFEWADIDHGTYHVEPDFEDDRVGINYVIDRVDGILSYNSCQLDDTGSEVRDCVRKDMLEEFKRELIYNLGVNRRNEHG